MGLVSFMSFMDPIMYKYYRLCSYVLDRIQFLISIMSLMNPSEIKWPFKMQRRQFPIVMSFAMTINKSQGHSLKKVGIYL